ncbi:MAG: helix-hairpin-helix domain-containing protein [Edaphobacter sp.]
MAANIQSILSTGTLPLREELLQKYRPTMLDLLRLPGMGPKTVALVWSSCQVCDIDSLEAAAKAGHLTKLPRMGEKFVTKLLKGIEDYRKNSSRFRIDKAQHHSDIISNLIREFPGIDEITPGRQPPPWPRDRRRPRPPRHRPRLRTRRRLCRG